MQKSRSDEKWRLQEVPLLWKARPLAHDCRKKQAEAHLVQADEVSTPLLMQECTTHLATTGQSCHGSGISPKDRHDNFPCSRHHGRNPAMAWLLPRMAAMVVIDRVQVLLL